MDSELHCHHDNGYDKREDESLSASLDLDRQGPVRSHGFGVYPQVGAPWAGRRVAHWHHGQDSRQETWGTRGAEGPVS